MSSLPIEPATGAPVKGPVLWRARSRFSTASSWYSIPAVPLVVASAPLALALVGSSAHTSQRHQMLDALVKLATCSATRQQVADRYLSHLRAAARQCSLSLIEPSNCLPRSSRQQVARQLAPFPYTHTLPQLSQGEWAHFEALAHSTSHLVALLLPAPNTLQAASILIYT